jgi:hypothetical protein
MDSPAVIELARQVDALRREMRAMARAAQGPRRSVDVTTGGTTYYGEDGTPLMQIGQAEDGTFGVVNVDPTVPPVPTDPDVTTALGGIHISETPDFLATDATQVTVFNSPNGGEFFYPLEDDIARYVALVAVSQSGVESAKSLEAAGSATITTSDIIDLQTSANGKNSITYATIDPNVNGATVGDTWFKFASAIVIGQWRWDGAAWVPQTIGDLLIANIDAGKITTGFLDAARVNAGTITADKLVLGLGENQIANAGFEDGLFPHTPANGAAISISTTHYSGAQSCKVDVPASTTQTSRLWAQGTHTNPAKMVRVKVGDRLHWGFWAKGDVGITTVDAWTMIKDATGAVQLQSVTGPDVVLTAGGTWTYVSVEVDVTHPDAVVAGLFVRGWNAGTEATSFFVDAMVGRAMVNGSLIVNGTITGSSLSADAIDGKVITGATFQTAATGKRWILSGSNQNQLKAYSGDPLESSPGLLIIDSVGGFPTVSLTGPRITGSTTEPAELSLSDDFAQLSGRQATIKGTHVEYPAGGGSPTVLNTATVEAASNATSASVDLSVSDVDSSDGGYVNLHLGQVGASDIGMSLTIDRGGGLSDNFYWTKDDGVNFQAHGQYLFLLENETVFKAEKTGTTITGGTASTPYIERYRAAARTATTGVFASLAWDGLLSTNKIGYSGDTATILVPGIYHLDSGLAFVANTTGRRIIRALVNGTEWARDEQDAGGATPRNVSISRTRQFLEGDTIKIEFWQNSGGNLDLDTTQKYTYFNLAWLGWGTT